MSKYAKTTYGIHQLLESRWSPRAFRDVPIEKDKLRRIFEAAAWSPSSWNEQPWRYIIGEKGGETYNKILDSLVETNSRWAKNAPVLIVCTALKHFSHNHHDNFHFLYDSGQSVAHLTFQAMYEGIYVHQMAGFHFEKLKTYFDIPPEFYITSVIALGYLGSPESLDDDFKERELAERERKDVSEIFYVDRFGQSWEF